MLCSRSSRENNNLLSIYQKDTLSICRQVGGKLAAVGITNRTKSEVLIMANKKPNVIRKACRRTATSKTIDVRSSLARKMLQMVVQFDLAYDQLKVHRKEFGGIPEHEGLELMKNAQQAVKEFSSFMEEFGSKVGFKYHPSKGSGAKK
jgi:hypothetical protein